jgi:hypothetical protein
MNLEKLLAENMRRFGTKNLNEAQKHRLKQLLLEDERIILQKPSDWGISGFNPPEISSESSMTSFEGYEDNAERAKPWIDAYNAYLDPKTGYVGKTLLVFKDHWIDYRNIVKRIVIQSSYVPGPKAKDVTAGRYQQGAQSYIKIWETKQATRNFELATKTAIMQKGGDPRQPGKTMSANIRLIVAPDSGIFDPTNGMVTTSGEYSIGLDFKIYQGGTLLGYAPLRFGDSVHKTEGWGSVLVSGGVPEADAWN